MENNDLFLGKVPPHSKMMEQALIGGIMMESRLFDEVADLLTPESFYVTKHKLIYKAMVLLAAQNKHIDLVNVVEQVTKNEDLVEVDGVPGISTMISTTSGIHNIRQYAEDIKNKYILRELLNIPNIIYSTVFDPEADQEKIIGLLEEKLLNIASNGSENDLQDITDVLLESVKQIEEWRSIKPDENGAIITGIPTGFDSLNEITRGWQPGNLIIIAARPSCGKTAFALNVVRAAAAHFEKMEPVKRKRKKVLIWSLEMKASRLALRLISAIAKIFLTKIQTGRLEDWEMKQLYVRAIEPLSGMGIMIDDNSNTTLQKIKSKARRLARKGQLGMIIIDYMQLVGADEKSGNREQEVSKLSRGLKNLSQETGVPVMALSQLSREVEKRKDRPGEPMLSDLRESGGIEQDADLVGMLYGASQGLIDLDASAASTIFVKIAKQRDGILDTVQLEFNKDIQLMEDIGKAEQALGLPGNFRPAPEIRHYNEPQKADDDTPF